MVRSQELEAVERLCASLLKDGSFNLKETSAAALDDVKEYLRRRRTGRMLLRAAKFLSLTGIFFAVAWLAIPPTFFEAIFRIGLIKMLPYWDWTYLRDVPCLIKSRSAALELADASQSNGSTSDTIPWHMRCSICEDLTAVIERKGGELTAFQVGEDFLVEELPLVIRRAFLVDEHSAVGKLDRILRLHLEDETMEPCRFRTNLKTKKAFQFDSFVRKVTRPDLQLSWFAFWEFCQHHHVKEARSIIPRPAELPLMLEVADSVWFFAAANHSAVTYKQVDFSPTAPVFWFTQMLGTSKVRLEPKDSCTEYCHLLETELGPGDGLLMTTELFHLSWLPGGDCQTEVLALAAGFK
ncbi:hypothetical protein RvY_03220 [Ramazzottius varieornatus]|uniref:Uncharacterized protein n=1 Tax=Ramazzottius varieornatus TaxID=947166 RepID=A0A1D1UQQ3_RAMVA|nr:hypothetical protein RvY_03220 [Ramazzottius varieornatus]